VTGRRGRRCRKLLDDLKGRRGYPHPKEEALDLTMWRARFGKVFRPVVRQTNNRIYIYIYIHIYSFSIYIYMPVPVAARSKVISAAARLLRFWVRIPPGAWMFVCCECCVLSARGLCDGLITRPEESYPLWRVVCVISKTS
jgi:hypothetical protein